MWKRIWEKIKNPNAVLLVAVYVITLLSCGFSIGSLFIDYTAPWFSAVTYAAYGIAAISLAYTVYTLIRIIPQMRTDIQDKLRSHPFTDKLMQNYGFRTVITASFSTAITLAFAVYNVVVCIIYRSAWYGSLAVYYILLLCMRGGIVLYHGKSRKRERKQEEEMVKYRTCGILLTVTIFALSAAIFKMVRDGATFERPGMMIYVVAAYTFWKLTMSIVNFIKAKKQEDYTVDALRNINVADAAVSLLSLQTSMIHSFSEGGMDYVNGITGAAVCVLVVALGVYMIVKGNMALKTYRERKENGQE